MNDTKPSKKVQAAIVGLILALLGAYAACAGCAGDEPYTPTGASIHVQLPCPCDTVDGADDATATTLPAAVTP